MRVSTAVLFAVFCLSIGAGALSVAQADAEVAAITLGRDPEPPFCADNPGGIVDISWDIEHETTPNRVEFFLEDPTRTIILDSQTYPGATGITINRQWVVPGASVDGKYWVRVEYWSFEAGNEANAEVTFYVCTDTGTICMTKWEDVDCNKEFDDLIDTPVPDYFLCVTTPFGDTFCRQTDQNGEVCFDNLPAGDYTVFDPVNPGWIPAGPTEFQASLGQGETLDFDFLNQRESNCYGACCGPGAICTMVKDGECIDGIFFGVGTTCQNTDCATPTEQKSWGEIKSEYR